MTAALDNEEAVDLNELAGTAGVGYFHFFKAFKQSMGVSPNQYMLERRVERAKALLARTELPIADIALRVGFSSQSHFATTFRRLAGATPRVYRATA
jgi:AraC family transcriptional regulator